MDQLDSFNTLISEDVSSQAERPLSLLLCGKSQTAVSSFAWEFFRRADSPVTFNVNDFDVTSGDPHRIYDHMFELAELPSDAIPVGVFHASNYQDAEWVRYFLAPMDVGAWSSLEGTTEKFGRPVIFCFGTTAKDGNYSFDSSFSEIARANKGVDFLARVRGHLDNASPALLGIEESAEDRISLIMRRMCEALAFNVASNSTTLDLIEDRVLEQLLAEVLDGIGFHVTLMRGTKDGGKDLILECNENGKRILYYIEVKHWRSGKKVGDNEVSHFIEVVLRDGPEKGLYLSTSGYTEQGKSVISQMTPQRVHLAGSTKIVNLCRTYTKTRSGMLTPKHTLTHILFSETH